MQPATRAAALVAADDRGFALVTEGEIAIAWQGQQVARLKPGKTLLTPQIVTGVWVGYDDNHSLGAKEYGGRVAAPIWLAYMKKVLEGRDPVEFARPDTGLTTAMIDPATGKLTRSGGIEETFLTGTAPTVYSSPGGAVANDGADDSFLLGQFED